MPSLVIGRSNDYPVREYLKGEIPLGEAPCLFREDDIVYSPNKYRETEGIKVQQNAIDKAKGIIAKPMPAEWYDRRTVLRIEDEEEREFQLSIIADKKPYFMRYIYPELMKDYNAFIRNTAKKSIRQFGKNIEDLLSAPENSLDEDEREFVQRYYRALPVNIGDCVTNRVCRRFEAEFGNHLKEQKQQTAFDYTCMKSGMEYPAYMYSELSRLYKQYNQRIRDYGLFADRERIDADEAAASLAIMADDFRDECAKVCPNEKMLCDVLLDVCYKRADTKSFVWEMCGDEIVANLLDKNAGFYYVPIRDAQGDIEYGGERFSVYEGKCELYG